MRIVYGIEIGKFSVRHDLESFKENNIKNSAKYFGTKCGV
jgi:hypothetical protein